MSVYYDHRYYRELRAEVPGKPSTASESIRMAEIRSLRAALKREYKILKQQTLTIRFTTDEALAIKDVPMRRADGHGDSAIDGPSLQLP